MSLKRNRSRTSSISQANAKRSNDSQTLTLPPISPPGPPQPSQMNSQRPNMAFEPQYFFPPQITFPFAAGPHPFPLPPPPPPPGFVLPPQQPQQDQQLQHQQHQHPPPPHPSLGGPHMIPQGMAQGIPMMHNQHPGFTDIQNPNINMNAPNQNQNQNPNINPNPNPNPNLNPNSSLNTNTNANTITNANANQNQNQGQNSNTNQSQNQHNMQPHLQVQPPISIQDGLHSHQQQHIFFPPLPPPPPPPPADDANGIMVPFICPPPPYDMAIPPPPLPFPPPNYMPYPLIASVEPPSPHEVIKSLIDASTKLPKSDMSIASAAASLFDLSRQIFDLKKYEEQNAPKTIEGTGEDVEEISLETDEHSVFELSKALPEGFLDIHPDVSDVPRFSEKSSETARVSKLRLYNEFLEREKTSSEKNKDIKIDKKILQKTATKILSHTGDVINANGNGREKRRQELQTSYNKIEDYVKTNREEIYLSKKRAIQERLDSLLKPVKPFQIPPCDSFISILNEPDFENFGIEKDEEMLAIDRDLSEKRDHEIVRIRLFANYELIKNLKLFYINADETFKDLNNNLLNKLNKLKAFFEYQKTQLGNLEKEAFDVSSTKSEKIFQNLGNKQSYFDLVTSSDASTRDFKPNSSEVANSRTSTSTSITATVASPMRSVSSSETENTTAENSTAGNSVKRRSRNVNVGRPSSKAKKVAGQTTSDTLSTIAKGVLHDFMPLVTDEEFQIITGDHKDKPQYLKFMAKYDTSGSDTPNYNSTTDTPVLGRRAGRPARIGNKENDPAMFAKIMKHYEPPSSLTSEEVEADFAILGIVSKWSK